MWHCIYEVTTLQLAAQDQGRQYSGLNGRGLYEVSPLTEKLLKIDGHLGNHFIR